MKLIYIVAPILAILVGATLYLNMNKGSIDKNSKENALKHYKELASKDGLNKATFAGGCFWCMEGPFQSLEGVEEVFAGYSGGEIENPTYKQVVAGQTKHRESVQVFFDPNLINYDKLLEIYWFQIDPTDKGGQFSDRGTQYTTAIFYHTDEQKALAEESINTLNESGNYDSPIVTQILPFKNFYPAEDYHQDFYLHSAERYKQYEALSGRQKYKEQIKKLFPN